MQSTICFALYLLSTVSLLSIVDEATASVAKPGCPEKCGSLTVPYPFGIGEGCFLNELFEVTCNKSSYSAKLSLFDSEVEEIAKHYVKMQSSIITFFYNKSSGEGLYPGPPGEGDSGEIFSVSRTQNKFVSVGCDIYAYIADTKTNEFISGCPSLCDDSQISPIASSSSCSGNRCCQMTIMKELTNFKLWVHTMNTMARSWESDLCSFSMIVENDFNDFNRFNLSRCNDTYNVPIILDWGIGSINCHEARKSGNFTCGKNSKCINSTRGVGYLCTCLQGYQGNPYLPDGCKDINECKILENNACPKEDLCVNTPGSYFCTCPSGYHRDSSFSPSRYACLPDRRKRSMVIFICLGVGLTVGLLILIVASICLHRRLKKIEENKNKKRFFKRNGGLLMQQQISSTKGSLSETKLFLTQELEKATDNFNASRILGKGGYGTVYKGMLSDGSIVAVKKSNKMDEDQVSHFINEVMILSQINHRHIVKLLGCCLETEVPLLVYEYVSNGTLSHHLHDDPNAAMISWENRLRIAAEVAGALAYLHSYASKAIFHRDIKSSNILLDENYRAVVSDFGISRSVPIDKTHLTTMVGGTFGYLDPEYFRSGQLNDKSDVYAFGVVLAELLTGQRAVSSNKSNEGLVILFRTSMKENRLFEILEKIVADESHEEEILAVAKLAKRCLKLNARKRPCMKEIAAELEQLRRIKEGLIGKEGFENGYCSASGRSYSCNFDVITDDDQEL